MREVKLMNIFLRILITAALAAIATWAILLLPPGMAGAAKSLAENLASFRILSVPASSVATAAIFILLMWFFVAPPLCLAMQTMGFRLFSLARIRRQIRNRQRTLLNWLLSRPAHWGITGTAMEPQHANTCEALLALRGGGFFEKKRESYRSALQGLVDSIVPTGLPSRTVNRPTVINTSMLLCLAALEKESPCGIIKDFAPYDEMAENLWFLHADGGWGPLILRADQKECRMSNTWWALHALVQYGYLDQPQNSDAFRQLLAGIFEKNRGGTFGYSASDAPRLAVTSMYLLLYYELPRHLRESIGQDYDPRAAAAFIYRRFVTEKCQVEIECVDGTFAGGSYIAHTPWKHISSAYAMRALAAAYKNGDLSRRYIDDVYRRTAHILSQDLRSPAANESCYLPADAELPRTGPYTFAAAHLILGLQALL